jgi:two-component system, NarL family, nitrate/nitrite response regulator NarL
MHVSPSDPIKVLLVDDHKSILWGLERLIESEQPKMKVVGKASTRAQALITAREAQPDVILLDVDLNGDNSLDFLPDLLELTHTRILILTGSRDLRLREQAMMQGACGIVLKEEQAEVIIKAIERVHGGELWLDRATTGRVFDQLANRGARDREAEKIASLTAKESKVVAAIVEHGGASNREIAKQLYVSEYTLRNHLTSVYSKLELHNRLELFMYATEHGLGKRTISSH